MVWAPGTDTGHLVYPFVYLAVIDGITRRCYITEMGRLDDIKWDRVSTNLRNVIVDCPMGTHKDLMKMWCNLQDVAKEVSKLEVVERRTMGSPGRAADEKLDELLTGIKNLDQMIMIAHLTQS